MMNNDDDENEPLNKYSVYDPGAAAKHRLNEECEALFNGFLHSEANCEYGNSTFPRTRVRGNFKADPKVKLIPDVNVKEVEFVLAKGIEVMLLDITLQARTLAEAEFAQRVASLEERQGRSSGQHGNATPVN
eukprot:UN08096